MKKIIFILFTFHISLLTLNAQWVAQYNPSSINLQDVTFINRYTGWVCGDGSQILKTTNGGVNWVLQSSGVSGKILTGIHAVDSQFVYCVGWWQTVLKTTDGGNNWIILRNGPQPPPQVGSFYGLYFLNRTTGLLLRNEYVLRTTNGGISFDSTHINFSYLRDVYFKDALTGVMCTDAAGIFKSTDGGVTWNFIEIPHYNNGYPDLLKESFIGNIGWIVGRACDNGLGNLVFRTTNFGTSWDTIGRVPYPYPHDNYCVFFSSLNTGWCGGSYGHIFKTTNGGYNWLEQVVPNQRFRISMWFYNDSIGWAVGGGGEILHTTTSGQYVDVKKISEKIPDESKLYQNYPNPFNSETIIEFDISKSEFYKLEIYDVLGRRIGEIFNKYFIAGKYRIKFNASQLSSGVYFYRLTNSNTSIIRKFTLIK
jgi:photosystem II stability/assembly factor-like uncharacterized protein